LMKNGWRFPSDCGDFALIGVPPHKDGRLGFTVLGAGLIESERGSIRSFAAKAQAKGWEIEYLFDGRPSGAKALAGTFGSCKITVWVPPGVEYPDVALLLGQETVGVVGTLTAVKLTDGSIHTSAATPREIQEHAVGDSDKTWWEKVQTLFRPLAGYGPVEAFFGPPPSPPPPALPAPTSTPAAAPAAAPAPTPELAVTLPRPVNCCPVTIPGPMEKADALLLAFCTPEQKSTWEAYGWLEARGQVTGDRYRIAHRHSPVAIKQGKPTWLLNHNVVVHAHLAWYPPAEEALALKLAVEGRESWIRNQSTIHRPSVPVFAHPFRGEETQALDGTFEAQFMGSLHRGLQIIQLITGSTK
jgi:hypothetical protein